ncbi:MAG TPA: ATP-binding protein [Pyrinomonadaceae bacterium]|nr:ATP-binding protein [Pyrinomonadaceae bacterium]
MPTAATKPKGSIHIVGESKSIGDEELRLWLQGYLDEHPHLSTTELSRSDHIGLSRTVLDAYLNGTYFLGKVAGGHGVNPANTKSEQAIRNYRDRVEGVIRHGYKTTFLETRSWKQFQHACKTAIEENVIVVVYARPGVGKSTCRRKFSASNMKTRPIEILCSTNITTKYFVQKIAREVKVADNKNTAEMEDLIAEKLKKNPRPLFVDQANYLHEKALGTICYLWEQAQMPVVLIGTKDLFELFNKSTLTEDVRVQLSSRVAMHYPLMDLSIDEIKTIVTGVLGPKATPQVIKQIADATHGNHRHLDMVMPRLAALIEVNEERIARGETQVEDLVDRAVARLMVG